MAMTSKESSSAEFALADGDRQYEHELRIKKDGENISPSFSPSLSPGRFDFSLTSRLTRRLGAAVRQTLDGIADATATMVKEWDEMENQYSQEEEDNEEYNGNENNDEQFKDSNAESPSSSTLLNKEEGKDNIQQFSKTFGDGQVHNTSFLRSYLKLFELERSQHFVASCRKAHCKLPWEVWISPKNTHSSDITSNETEPANGISSSSLPGEFVEHAALKAAVLKLSEKESTFTEPILENDAMIFDEDEPEDDRIGKSRAKVVSTATALSSLCMLQRCTNHRGVGGVDGISGDEIPSNVDNFLVDCRATTRRLYQVDTNLRGMYKKLVSSTIPVVSEELFWRNYFYHCERLRTKILFEHGDKVVKDESNDDEDDDDTLVKIGAADLAEIPVPPRIPRTLSEGSIVLICDNEEEESESSQ